ncbi:hypothetical protein [Photobacterium indicum]|uniref:hypothetical protein n=1 Tax=Photobacterium indicum TaxID=81447 RepID=UPI003D0AF461
MKNFKLSRMSLLIITCLPFIAKAGVTDGLELISSESTGIKKEIHEQTDNSRIYLKEGAIWATRDITKVDPVLNISLSDEVEIENDTINSNLNFNVQTNYSYYVKKWQLEVYQGKDSHLSQPLATLSGDKLSNDFDIDWDGKTQTGYKFESGKQLLFRLKVWDKDGNMDISTIGVADMVKPTKEVDIDKFDDEDDKNGRSYGEAKLMRHNIPTSSGMAKLMGTGLKGIDKVYIGDDEYDIEDNRLYVEQYLPTDAYMFPVRVEYDNGDERKYQLFVRIPDTYYSQAGIADLYLGKNRVSGNKDVLGVDEQYQGDIYNRGRLAYFGEGKFGDKLRVVAHVDTKEAALKDMFKNPFAADETTVFDIVEDDDEMYYGNYGDNANIQKVVNTKGKVYLDVQYDKSRYLWGNYNTGVTGTETGGYNRSLYGFKGDYRTRETTKFGDDKLNIVGFASQADSLYSHDEFLGTGGSLYFLRHGEVVPGSDKVSVKVIDKDTNIAEKQVYLQSGRDYEIDEYQGRLILTRPLSDIVGDDFGTVIDSGPRGDLENYLTVDYEYVPEGSEAIDKMATGGRVKGWVNDNVGVGATYVQEEKDDQDYEMYASDLTLRATEGTYLKTEFGHSEGTQADSNFVSFDGGLSFDEVSSGAKVREGDSIEITGVASLYDLMPDTFGAVGNDVRGWYKNKDAGYSYASQTDDLAQEAYGTQLRLQTGDKSQVLARYKHIEEQEENGDITTDTDEIELEIQYMVTEHVKVAVAGKHIEELNNQDEKGDGDLVGARVEYIFDDDNSVYAKTQKTINQSSSYDQNDSVTVGAETKITEDWTLSGEYTSGDRGDAAEATVNYDVTDDYSTYVSYVEDEYDDKNNIVFGQKATLTDTIDVYQENQFVDENNGKGRIDSFGFDYDMDDDIEAGIAFQQGTIDYPDEVGVERKATSLYVAFDQDNYTLKDKVEYRVDDGEEKIRQYVTTNRYTHHLTDEYTLFAKFNYSKSENATSDEVVERFIESNMGLAYRPIFNDRLNFLTRYTYLVDFDNMNRDVDYKDEKSHIIEGETIYSVDAHIDVGAKVAYKKKDEIYTRESGADVPVKNDIFLTGLSASYNVMKSWDVTGEYHWKKDQENNQLEHGALVSVNKHINDNMKVGVGYNFSSFEDDLVHNDDYDAEGIFINVVGKF